MRLLAKSPALRAYIVHVPRTSKPDDVQAAYAELARIEQSVQRDHLIAHVESPELLLMDTATLADAERANRAQNLSLLQHGYFKEVHFSGSQVSAYVREIIMWTFHLRLMVHNVAVPGSLLARYLSLHDTRRPYR